MKRLAPHSVVALAINIALLALFGVHTPDFLRRASVPCRCQEDHGRVVVAEVGYPASSGGLLQGDRLLSWEDTPLRTEHEVDFLADMGRIGDRVHVRYQRGDSTASSAITLVPFYHVSYVISMYGIGIVTLCVAVFVLLMRQRERTAIVLYWSMVSMAVAVMASWEGRVPGNPLGYLYGALFVLSYLGVATTFILFTTMFPRPLGGSFWLRLAVLYAPACVLAGLLIGYNSAALASRSLELLDAYQSWFDVWHLILIIYIVAGLLVFVRSYVRSESASERKKMKWILLGLCLGPTPFLFLNVLPELLQVRWTVPEEYTLGFLVVIPVSFAISFVRYHVMDVEFVINRATVYAIVLGICAAVYIACVAIVGGLAGTYSVGFSAGAAILVAVLFQPVRSRVQHFVDRRFFRVQYNFREAERKYIDEMKAALDVPALARLMVERTDDLIPVERIGFFQVREQESRLQVLAHRNYDVVERHGVRFEMEHLRSPLRGPVGIPEKIEQGVPCEHGDAAVFHRWGIALVFPMVSQSSGYLAFLVLGERKSGGRFTMEDIDLLHTVTTQAAAVIDRLNLQQKVMVEHAEAQHYEELSRLKSDFVSYVSHELRTPLTTIKLFSELLERRVRSARKPKEYLAVIRGEADRLDRMVSTILDAARIDEGVKEYRMTVTDLRDVTSQVLATMKYQLEKQGFHVVFSPARGPLVIHADPDAVAQAIINLVTNAIKYSGERKFLKVALGTRDGMILCAVSDHGLGISREAIPHLFEKFYRDPGHRDEVGGVGLGLPLVKHIMSVHAGNVSVRSEPGKGSTFTLAFPAHVPD